MKEKKVQNKCNEGKKGTKGIRKSKQTSHIYKFFFFFFKEYIQVIFWVAYYYYYIIYTPYKVLHENPNILSQSLAHRIGMVDKNKEAS